MIIDGRALADAVYHTLKEEIASLPKAPRLTVVTCAPTFETQKFLAIKRTRATEVGIDLEVITCPEESTTDDCIAALTKHARTADGVVVQLPFPTHINTEALIAAIPKRKDVDALTTHVGDGVLPPVVGAIAHILDTYSLSPKDARVVVVGHGRLVGAPAAQWFKGAGAQVTVLTKNDADIGVHTRNADIVVLGAGVPHILTSDMVRDGVMIFDAGTSEEGGVLTGDADPGCAKKAALFTPVPGGIGPLTVAFLFKNLINLVAEPEHT